MATWPKGPDRSAEIAYGLYHGGLVNSFDTASPKPNARPLLHRLFEIFPVIVALDFPFAEGDVHHPSVGLSGISGVLPQVLVDNRRTSKVHAAEIPGESAGSGQRFGELVKGIGDLGRCPLGHSSLVVSLGLSLGTIGWPGLGGGAELDAKTRADPLAAAVRPVDAEFDMRGPGEGVRRSQERRAAVLLHLLTHLLEDPTDFRHRHHVRLEAIVGESAHLLLSTDIVPALAIPAARNQKRQATDQAKHKTLPHDDLLRPVESHLRFRKG